MQPQMKNRRKKLVILREMQNRIILRTTMFPLIGLAILTITLTVFCRRLMAEAATEEVILPSLEPLLAAVICLTAGFAVTILYVALHFSQRIAGPTYRITESLKEVQEQLNNGLEDGKIDLRVKLRDGDFLEEIASELNVTLATFETVLRRSGAAVESAQASARTETREVEA